VFKSYGIQAILSGANRDSKAKRETAQEPTQPQHPSPPEKKQHEAEIMRTGVQQ
jgi:hypothetical protein